MSRSCIVLCVSPKKLLGEKFRQKSTIRVKSDARRGRRRAAAGRFYRPILHESKTFEMKQKTMKFEIPGLIRVGSAHRLFSGTVLDLTSQYTGFARARRVCVRLNVHTPLELAMCVHLNLHTCVHIRFYFLKSWLVYMYLRAYTRIYIYIYIARA